MSTFDDEYGDSTTDGPKALRDAYEAEKKARQQLEQRLAKLEAEERSKSIAAIVTEKGLNPKVADLIPADQKPEEWLEKYGDLFGGTTPSADEGAVSEQSGEATVSPEEQELLQRAADSGSGVSQDAIAGLRSRLDQATSAEDVARIMAEAGF